MSSETLMTLAGSLSARMGLDPLEELKAEALAEASQKRDQARSQACPVVRQPESTELSGVKGTGLGNQRVEERQRGVIQETRLRYFPILTTLSGESYCFTIEQQKEAWEIFEIIYPELSDEFTRIMQPMIDLEFADSPSIVYN